MQQHRLSDRTFGFTLAGVCGLAAIAGWFFFARDLSVLGSCSLVLAGLAIIKPRLLMPLNSGFAFVAVRISVVMSLVILAALFVLVITPLGLMLRLWRRDPLEREVDGAAHSYWIPASRQIVPSSFHDLF